MQPLISIITPSFNQVEFLEDTLTSVLGQSYPLVEYIVMDGGSSDGSAELLRRYSPRLAYWQSQKDSGQAHAINAGMARAKGDILAWLNSDDMYLPGTLAEVAGRLNSGKAQFLAGDCVTIDPAIHRASYSNVPQKLKEADLTMWDFLVQPSTFWTRKAWEAAGPLDETLHYGFDWEWFIRVQKAGAEFLGIERCLSIYRIHPGHKTGQGNSRRAQELALIYERYHGPNLSSAFLRAVEQRSQIEGFVRLLRKCRLQEQRGKLLKLRFSGLFRNLTERQVEHVVAMI